MPDEHEAGVYAAKPQFVTTGVDPSLHDAGTAATPATAALPPILAANDTLLGDNTAGTRAVVPGVTVKLTVVILPVASAIVSGTWKPPHPSATAFDVNRKIPP